jgi:RecB family endonuclease NucS
VEKIDMPIELGIWRLGKQLERLSFAPLDAEEKLQSTIAGDISVLAPGLMLIGQQVLTSHGKYIDLLAMDSDGNLHVIELKKHKTPREAVGQLLDYASWVETLTYEEIGELYAKNHGGKEFERALPKYSMLARQMS